MAIFTGSAVALVTPFTKDGVNTSVVKELVAWHIAQGTDAIVACGTTGEPSTMEPREREQVIDAVVRESRGRVPVIAGTGGNNTSESVQASRRAQDLGADALLVVTPYYNKTTQHGLIAHFTAIADAVSIPVIIYNVPVRTGLNMTPATLKSLCAHPRIRGMKEASADISQITEMARLCPDIDLYSGNDDHILPVLSLGGQGVISVLANVCPKLTHQLVERYMAGDVAGCRALQFQLNPLVKALFCEVNPVPVKTAMRLMGFDVGPLRMPLVDMLPENQRMLEREMRALSLIAQ